MPDRPCRTQTLGTITGAIGLWRTLLVAAITFMAPNLAGAAEITVLSTRATEELSRELVPQFETASGHKVIITFTGTQDLQKRIAAGEQYDLIIIIDSVVDGYIRSGKVVSGTHIDIARSSVGIGLHAGLPRPDVSSTEALKRALLSAKSVGYSTGPSGALILDMLQKMNIADAVRPKLRQAPSGMLVGNIIASGEAEIGFQQINELSHFPGVDYLGPLPAEFQETTWRSGGVMVGAKEPGAALELLKFLSGPAAAPMIRKHGLKPK